MSAAPGLAGAGEDPLEPSPRLRAVWDLSVAGIREGAGVHDYDGAVQDLSDAGITAGLARLGQGAAPADPHDALVIGAAEAELRWHLGEYRAHHRDPLLHLDGLDLACYDRDYAPQAERAQARLRHLRQWPDAVDVAVTTLDAVPAAVAGAALPSARGLADLVRELPDAGDLAAPALAAVDRLVAHLEGVAATGNPDCAVGAPALAAALGTGDCATVDLSALAARAETERDRLRDMLVEACRELDPARPVTETVARLLADHPDTDGVLREAATLTEEVLEFTREHELVPWCDGECRVGPAPPSRRWAMAMMAWTGPFEDDAASWYHVTPPEASWPAEDVEAWLSVFSRTSLPAITVHEVAPGHYAHARALRRAPSAVRRSLLSGTFVEGWAHYAEELMLEEGFRAGDPRYLVGMCLEALVRVTRLSCSIGLHTGALDVADATARFEADAFLAGAAARSEAVRGTFDIGYGRYTWGKLEILAARDRARRNWGSGYSTRRFHDALMTLGAPPIGLLGDAVARSGGG